MSEVTIDAALVRAGAVARFEPSGARDADTEQGQELVFTGTGLRAEALHTALTACLTAAARTARRTIRSPAPGHLRDGGACGQRAAGPRHSGAAKSVPPEAAAALHVPYAGPSRTARRRRGRWRARGPRPRGHGSRCHAGRCRRRAGAAAGMPPQPSATDSTTRSSRGRPRPRPCRRQGDGRTALTRRSARTRVVSRASPSGGRASVVSPTRRTPCPRASGPAPARASPIRSWAQMRTGADGRPDPYGAMTSAGVRFLQERDPAVRLRWAHDSTT